MAIYTCPFCQRGSNTPVHPGCQRQGQAWRPAPATTYASAPYVEEERDPHAWGDIPCPTPTHWVQEEDGFSLRYAICSVCKEEDQPMGQNPEMYIERNEYGDKFYYWVTPIQNTSTVVSTALLRELWKLAKQYGRDDLAGCITNYAAPK